MPKTIAARYGIRPGDDIESRPAGAVIHIVPPGRQTAVLSPEARLKLYDAATARRRRRQTGRPKLRGGTDRRWRREDRYAPGRAR